LPRLQFRFTYLPSGFKDRFDQYARQEGEAVHQLAMARMALRHDHLPSYGGPKAHLDAIGWYEDYKVFMVDQIEKVKSDRWQREQDQATKERMREMALRVKIEHPDRSVDSAELRDAPLWKRLFIETWRGMREGRIKGE